MSLSVNKTPRTQIEQLEDIRQYLNKKLTIQTTVELNENLFIIRLVDDIPNSNQKIVVQDTIVIKDMIAELGNVKWHLLDHIVSAMLFKLANQRYYTPDHVLTERLEVGIREILRDVIGYNW